MWNQVYDPLQSKVFSTIAAALPVLTLLALIASNKVKAHLAAIIALVVANLVAIFVFTMPAGMSGPGKVSTAPDVPMRGLTRDAGSFTKAGVAVLAASALPTAVSGRATMPNTQTAASR